MNITKEFDLAIKLSEGKSISNGYIINGKEYTTYMTNDEWEAFKSSMLSHALIEYGEGGGDELSEKDERPPKMASYGSSSRMLYKISNFNKNFHYEKKLFTTVGGTANLDGFYENENHYIFVEAKCHEPYSSKKTSISKSYEKLYKYINKQMNGNLEIVMKPSSCARYLNVDFFSNQKKIEHFDIKQMICHLLGISTGILKGTLKQKQTDFIYLLYDPTNLNLPEQTKETVNLIYSKTCQECDIIDFKALFKAILLFLKAEKYKTSISHEDTEKIINQFSFSRLSQENYISSMK